MIHEVSTLPPASSEPQPTPTEAEKIERISTAALNLAGVYGSTEHDAQTMNERGMEAIEQLFATCREGAPSLEETDPALKQALAAALAQMNLKINKLHHISAFDEKTGAFSHEEFLRKVASDAQKFPDRPCAILRIDLNEFKTVNDTFGHIVGDNYLRAVADIINQSIPGDAFLGRMGGDEFSIFLPGHDEASAEALKQAINSAFTGESIPAPSSEDAARVVYLRKASIGVASATPTTNPREFASMLDAMADERQREDKETYRTQLTEQDRRRPTISSTDTPFDSTPQ